MPNQEASYVYRGKVAIGTYDVLSEGAHETISVRYNGEELTTGTCGLSPQIVATTLLGELVVGLAESEKARSSRRK